MENDANLTVFEKDDDGHVDFATEEGRPRALLIAGAVAALALAGLIVALLLARPSIDQEAANIVRAGSPEFDAYKDKVALEIDADDKMVDPNMIGMWQLRAKVKFRNNGDRELRGIEVVGKLIDFENKPLAQIVRMPIPRAHPEPLKPGESVDIWIKVDAPAKVTEAEVKDIIVEVRGLRFQ